MFHIFKKELIWAFFFMFLIVFFNLMINVSMASNNNSKVEVSVRGTYLRADPTPDSPGIIDLESNGFSEGDSIIISFEGSFDRYGQSDYETLDYLIGVFSSTDQLLFINMEQRVPGAIEAGEDFTSSDTWFSNENTDIPEDFEISPASGFSITIPENAKYLFVCLHDSYYPDNTSLGPIEVSLKIQSGLPWEILLLILIVVAVIIFLIFFYMRKKKKNQIDS